MTMITTLYEDTLHRGGHHLVDIVPVTTITVPPYTTTNAIFFGRKQFWVIDPGTPHDDQRQILKRYVDHRIQNGDLFSGVCLTHHHGDHTKAARFLAQTFSVPIYAHKNAAQFLSFAFHGLDDKSVISSDLHALHTPGHAEDHVVYYAHEEGILFAGDMITDRGTILIPPNGGSLRIYLESLDLLTRMKLTAIVPAHGHAIVENPNLFLLRAMKHRYDRIKAVFDVLKHSREKRDATDITHQVYRASTADNLMFFAQLSVESSLYWLKEHNLVENPNYMWLLAPNALEHEQAMLLERLAQIDERLRHA